MVCPPNRRIKRLAFLGTVLRSRATPGGFAMPPGDGLRRFTPDRQHRTSRLHVPRQHRVRSRWLPWTSNGRQ
jgi:hypothetical protein